MNRNILVVDCGSTGIRSLIFNNKGKIINREYRRIGTYHPEAGATENDPEHIWSAFKEVVSKALKTPFIKIETIGITNQRSTFALWDKATGKPLTNFINWQDVRAADTARQMNNNPVWRTLKTFSFFVGRLIKNPLLTVTSMLNLTTDHTICKLKWILDNNPAIKKKCLNNEVHFGTIDTWLLYRLSGNREHSTDFTNAAATTLLNPFLMKWNSLFCKVFKIPMNILPKVYDTNDFFGKTDKNVFGKSIPITCLAGDQQASLFGHRCFKKGDVKISLGSGAFVCMNVGSKPKFSTKGLFPLIGWTFKGVPDYILEGQVATVGTYINWAVEKMNFFKNPKELDDLASQCQNTEGLFCIPTLTGIRFPYFKPDFKSSISGLSLLTEKKHLARGIIEGITHRVIDIIEGMEKDTKVSISNIKVDGGVSNSDILLQCLADFSGKEIYRSSEHDLTSVGAAYFAGLAVGIWQDKEDILRLHIPHKKFTPSLITIERERIRKEWKNHIKQIQKEYKK